MGLLMIFGSKQQSLGYIMIKPSDETLQQGRNRDHGKLIYSPSFEGISSDEEPIVTTIAFNPCVVFSRDDFRFLFSFQKEIDDLIG
jgi:hypothetical protein